MLLLSPKNQITAAKTEELKCLQWQFHNSQDCTYQQLQENHLLIGGVLPFRQLWQQTQIRGHLVECIGTMEKDETQVVSQLENLHLQMTHLADALIQSRMTICR